MGKLKFDYYDFNESGKRVGHMKDRKAIKEMALKIHKGAKAKVANRGKWETEKDVMDKHYYGNSTIKGYEKKLK